MTVSTVRYFSEAEFFWVNRTNKTWTVKANKPKEAMVNIPVTKAAPPITKVRMAMEICRAVRLSE